MKKQKKLFLTIFGILFVSLGISVACSLSDDKDKGISLTEDEASTTGDTPVDDTPVVDIPIDPNIFEEFKANYMGTYTAETTAVLTLAGKTMIFNNSIGITTMLLDDNNLWLLISFSESTGESEILHFSFLEGASNNEDENYMQEVIMPATSTNITLKNSEITTLTEFLGQDSRLDLTINLDTGFLFLNGVKIGTKNP